MGLCVLGGISLPPLLVFSGPVSTLGSAGRPVGLYFPKAGATELYSLYRLCVITEQRQEGCSALKQHNPTSNPHSNHLLPPSEKERLTEKEKGCKPVMKIHRSTFFSHRPNEESRGSRFLVEWMVKSCKWSVKILYG